MSSATSFEKAPGAFADSAAAHEFDLVARPERRGSFDIGASVRMYRYDMHHYDGVIQPETYERVDDEEFSLLAEGADRAACSEFVLVRSPDGDDCLYYREGEWRPYKGMLETGLRVAEEEAEADPRRQFLAEEAVQHLDEWNRVQALKPGEQHVWDSPYRKDIESLYGKQFMSADCGRFPGREMGFIYRACCTQDGNIILQSQTVDRSNEQAFAAVRKHAAENDSATMNELVDAYDKPLAEKAPGKRFFAGRLGAELHQNAWKTVLAQQDLRMYFRTRLEGIARSPLEGLELEKAIKRHMYGVWAAFKERMDGKTSAPTIQVQKYGNASVAYYAMLHQRALETERQVLGAYRRFVNRGEVMVGCGGSISMLKGENDILNANPEEVFSAIFGKGNIDEDKLGSRNFTCPKGCSNYRRIANVKEKTCQKCGIDVSCEAPKPKAALLWRGSLGVKRRTEKDRPIKRYNVATGVGKKALAGAGV